MTQFSEAWEQMIKVNKELMDHWSGVMSEMPWTKGSKFPMGENVNPWIDTMRSGYQTFLASWSQMMNQSLEMFFKSLGETGNYRRDFEKQIRQNWEELNRAQQTQLEMTAKFFANLASFLKGDSEPSQP